MGLGDVEVKDSPNPGELNSYENNENGAHGEILDNRNTEPIESVKKTSKPSIAQLPAKELRELLQNLGLKSQGHKTVLKKRLKAYWKKKAQKEAKKNKNTRHNNDNNNNNTDSDNSNSNSNNNNNKRKVDQSSAAETETENDPSSSISETEVNQHNIHGNSNERKKKKKGSVSSVR